MKKFLLSTAVAASVMAVSSLAAPNIATDGTGQYLIGGGYYAQAGWETGITLMNTNLTHSVIMRGVIREYVSSEEIDFTVTLTPGDVWEGKIYVGADGSAYLKSDDDSNYRVSTSKIKDGFSMKKQFEAAQTNIFADTPTRAKERSFEKGYIEFYPIAQVQHNNPIYGTGVNFTNDGVSSTGVLTSKINKNTLYNIVDELASNTIPANTVAVDNDSVAGYVTLYATSKNAAMKLPMLAIENLTDLQPVSGSNMRPGNDTVITSYINDVAAREVRALLNLQKVAVPYEAKAKNHGLRFVWWNDGRYYQPKSEDCVQQRIFNFNVRDMEENRPVTTVESDVISPWRPGATLIPNTGCEFGYVDIPSTITKYTNLDAPYEKGMVVLQNFVDTTDNERANLGAANRDTFLSYPRQEAPGGQIYNTSAVVSFMSATDVGDGKLSYNWIYPVVERNGTLYTTTRK